MSIMSVRLKMKKCTGKDACNIKEKKVLIAQWLFQISQCLTGIILPHVTSDWCEQRTKTYMLSVSTYKNTAHWALPCISRRHGLQEVIEIHNNLIQREEILHHHTLVVNVHHVFLDGSAILTVTQPHEATFTCTNQAVLVTFTVKKWSWECCKDSC